MKKYIITLIAAASIAVPVVALAHQGDVTPRQSVNGVRQEDRGVQAQQADDHGQVRGDDNAANRHDMNENQAEEANENQAEEAAEATQIPTASPSPNPTPAIEDRMHEGGEIGDDNATEVDSSGRGTNSGPSGHDGSND